mgnify:CR=1 FL=1
MYIKDFEIWLLENDLQENELFNQSLKCYRVEAYKAAFLYSYLALIDHVKELIINYKGIPKNFKPTQSDSKRKSKWKLKVQTLDNENTWEENTLNFIKENNPGNIFLIDDVIRNEFMQKKDIRNTCVHNKDREVTSTTVAELWNFIKYAYPLLVIDGSVDTLKDEYNKIVRFAGDEYNKKINKLYNFYKKLTTKNKKEFFEFLLKDIEENINDYIDSKYADEFLEKIFDSSDAEEYKWIDDKSLKLYCYLSINNTDLSFLQREEWMEIIYDDKKTFLKIAIPLGYPEKINNILREIYINHKFEDWFEILSRIITSFYEFELNDSILEIIATESNLNYILNKVEKNLYTYRYLNYDNTTNTFDYTMFGKYSGHVKMLLILAEKNKVSNQRIDEVVNRAKLVIDENNNDENLRSIKEFLEKDRILLNWLNN